MNTAKTKKQGKEGEFVVIGWKRIARCLGVCENAARNWREKHGFPVMKLPDGRVATTKGLIDQWFMARIELQGDSWRRPWNRKPENSDLQGKVQVDERRAA